MRDKKENCLLRKLKENLENTIDYKLVIIKNL